MTSIATKMNDDDNRSLIFIKSQPFTPLRRAGRQPDGAQAEQPFLQGQRPGQLCRCGLTAGLLF